MRTRFYLAAAATVAVACSSTTSPTTTASGGSNTGSAAAPAMYSKFDAAVAVSSDGSTVTLRATSVPDHKSPYFGAGDTRYEAPHAGMVVNPNLIVSQNLVMRVPASPSVATASDTPMGPIGVAVNGVALFNQYAAGRSPLGPEILSFDRYSGHPQQTGQYHYHLEPLWLTGNRGAASLIGVLLDGFPVYAPRETSGATPTGLDSCNGHTHATPEFAGGIYHYHVTSSVPYISGCFRGTPGSLG